MCKYSKGIKGKTKCWKLANKYQNNTLTVLQTCHFLNNNRFHYYSGNGYEKVKRYKHKKLLSPRKTEADIVVHATWVDASEHSTHLHVVRAVIEAAAT